MTASSSFDDAVVATVHAETSSYGPFPVTEEPRYIDLLIADIQAEGRGIGRVVRDFSEAVGDDERSKRAAELLEKHIADRGVGMDLGRLIEVLYFAGRQGLLRKYALKFPAYNILEQFFEGSVVPQGPRLDLPPEYPGKRWTLFGREIGFPIGIPASVLTNNFEWVQYFFNAGFCVLTTRTVRSHVRDANPAPNWVFASSVTEPWRLGESAAPVVADLSDWVDAGSSDVSTCNSFGVPSVEPAVWMADLRRSLKHVQPGQVLIASVMGDVYETGLDREQITAALQRDFVTVALMAESCGAEFIELNLSCPNSLAEGADGVRPPLCYDISQTIGVIERVRKALKPNTKLIAKLSYMTEPELENLLLDTGHLLDGVAGINTMPTRVVTRTNEPTFGARAVAGVSGAAVRNYGIDFVKSLVRLRLRLDLSFEILGMGGVTDEASFREMFEAGASAVMSASGAFANPYLADQCIRSIGNALGGADTTTVSDVLLQEVTTRTFELMPVGVEVDEYDLAIRLALPGDQALAAVRRLVDQGVVKKSSGRKLILA